MPAITVFEKPTCTTCRKLVKLLAEHGIEADRIDYQVLGLSRGQLDEIVAKTGLAPRELLRTREPEYKELGLDDPSVDGEAILDAMVEHPALLQRPVVIKGDKAVLARPVEKVLELL